MTISGKRSYEPDPKPGKRERKPTRLVNRDATTRAVLLHPTCPCGKRAATGHHVIARGDGGDDVIENIVPLCGSGTTGCHGLLENEDVETRRMVGAWIVKHRGDVIDYVLGHFETREIGADWLRRRLYVRKSSIQTRGR